MSYQIKPASIAGRIGKGFAQGISEQLPKEVERGRLSSGLQALKEQAEAGASPFDMATSLLTTPGITPEMAQYLQPYLQSAALQSQQKLNRSSNVGASPVSGQQVSAPQVGQRASEQGLQKIDYSTHQPFRRIGTPQALADRATEFGLENPVLYPTRESQEAAALKEYNFQKETISNIAAGFKPILEAKIQKSGDATYSSVLGDLQQDFINNAEEDVLQGKLTEKEAINKYTAQALDFAKAKTALDALPFSYVNPSDTLKSLNAIKKDYKKFGKLEEFKNEIISKFNLTDQNASSLVYPIEQNKEINSYIKTIPPKIYPRSGKTAKGKAISDQEVVDNVYKNLTDEDSLFSIVKELEAKNYVASDIMKLFEDKWNKGKSFSKEQQNEMKRPSSPRPSLGDLFLFKLAGKSVMGE